jgi:membrane protein insertase Oxa1/YidC/SpoIIIJ
VAAGVGLYWAASSLFGTLQSWVIQREVRPNAA